MKDKERLKITLSPEDRLLLDSLAHRFNRSKSNILHEALNVYASKNKHNLTIIYRMKEEDPKPQTDEQIKHDMEIIKTKWIED